MVDISISKAWEDICGENFTAWNWQEKNLNICFENILIICPINIIFAVVSTAYLAFKGRTVRRSITHSHLLRFRATVSFFMILCPIINLLLKMFYLKMKLTAAFYITTSIVSFSWWLHFMYVVSLHSGLTAHSRGPRCMVSIWFLTLLTTFIHIYSVILHPSPTDIAVVEELTTYTAGALQMIYLSTLIPKGKALVTSTHQLLTVNVDDEERAPFIESTSANELRHRGSVWSDLGVAAQKATALSLLSFRWVNPLVHKGAEGNLWNVNSLFELPYTVRTSYVYTRFWILYKDLQLRINVKQNLPTTDEPSLPGRVPQVCKQKVSLLRALLACFGTQYFILGVLKFFSDMLTFAGPLLLNGLLKYIENPSAPSWYGYLYALGLLLGAFLSSILGTQFNYRINVVALRVRAAIVTTVYRKALATTTPDLNGLTTGEIVNYMSTDTERIQNFCPSFHQFWSLPIQLTVCLVLLYLEVGWAFLAGFAFAVILIPINRVLASFIGKYSTAMMEQKDKRVQLMTEILTGVGVIKLYTWENHFKSWIEGYRKKELKYLKYRKYLDAGCVYFWATTPVVVSLLIFLTYVLLGNTLTAAKVFTCIALVNILIMPLNAFPWVLNGLVEAWVSLKRIEQLLQLPEINLSAYYVPSGDNNAEIQIKDADFVWKTQVPQQDKKRTNGQETSNGEGETTSASHKTFRLQSIDLEVYPSQLVIVVGQVGSGKTSLLQAIAAEMEKTRGQVSVAEFPCGYGYVPQEPWIQQNTIRNNILFGKPFLPSHYQATLNACSLIDDLSVLPADDETEVGERGVTLSGGQKSRIALARAVYQDKQIYLLDDPLSAVDAHVAQRLFDNCITGLLKDKTRILCTHHVDFVKFADVIVVMQDGKIIHKGNASEILPMLPPILSSIRPMSSKTDSDAQPTTSTSNENDIKEIPEEVEHCKIHDGSLVESEECDVGSIKYKVYKSYWLAIGPLLASVVLVMLTLMQGTRNATDIWLAHWVSESTTTGNRTTNVSEPEVDGFRWTTPLMTMITSSLIPHFVISQHWSHNFNATSSGWYEESGNGDGDDVVFYLVVYGILVGVNSFFTLLRAFFFAYGGVTAAKNIHNKLLDTLFKAPSSFFDRNPLGRILNRFSSDLYAVDDTLPFMLNILLAQCFGLIGTFIVTCYGLPLIMLIIIPLFSLYLFIQNYYRHTSRELKRLSALTLSPIYAHFSETLSGVSTIRALRAETRFRQENEERLEKNQRVQFAIQAASQWLNLRLQMIGVVLVAAVSLLAVLRLTNASLIGLAISYALTVTNLLNGVVWSFTETEKEMVSAERALQYIDGMESEKWDGIFEPLNWPQHGLVSFRAVCLRYRENMQFALNNVSFDVLPGEKIGIVGRTGAGKSSIFKSLFRLLEITSGEIVIDDVNISRLDLFKLRSSLAIIPQEPFIFTGTVRSNLDPANEYTDSELWLALQQCHLEDAVDKLGGLESLLAERGNDLSAGQKQLLCLARALLRKSKILCIDEATANVDYNTDHLIQQTIRANFRNHTILTIAHRMETILDCDKILVMSNGQAHEFDTPQNLLANEKSLFSKLVHKTQQSQR